MSYYVRFKAMASVAALATAWMATSVDLASAQKAPLPPITVDQPRALPRPIAAAISKPMKVRTRRPVRAARRPVRRNQTVAAPPSVVTPPPIFNSIPTAFRGIQREGTATQGYKVSTATDVGPFGNIPLQDTPYSVYVVPKEFIENTQTYSTYQLFKIDPFTQPTENPGRAGQTYVNIRGFSVTQQFQDGLRKAPNGQIPLEDKERVEVFTGLTGFLYGQTDPGGTINYVLKRPTATPFHELTVGDPGGGSGYGHIDIGGPLDGEGRIGYRLNLAGNTGSTPITYQRDTRQVYSGALDFHITPNAVVQLDLSHYKDDLHGTTPSFSQFFAGGITQFPKDAPNASTLYSQPWSQLQQQNDRVAGKFIWDINSILQFRAGVDANRFNQDPYNIFTVAINNNLSITPFEGVNAPLTAVSRSEFGFLDAKFDTGPISHKVTFGFNGSYQNSYNQNTSFQDCVTPIGAQGFTNCKPAGTLYGGPIYVPQPANEYQGINYAKFRVNGTTNNNILLGDIITLNPQTQVIVGVNRAQLAATNYSNPNVIASGYDKAAYSPSASFVFKPVPWATTYFTYIQGLEQGAIVGANYTNANQALPPAIDQQYEVGVKVDRGGVLYTAALFNINKINQFSNNAVPVPTFVQDGREIHKGIELSAQGKATENLTIVGGFTAFQARVQQAATVALNGLRPVDVPEVQAKVYAEYRLPFLQQVVLNGGANYFGDFAVNTSNTQNLPGITTYDVGARYETVINNYPTVFRVYTTNVLNRSYWSAYYQVGDPRRIAGNVSIRF